MCDVGLNDPAEVDMLVSNSGTNLQTMRIHFGKEVRRTEGVETDLQRFGVTKQALDRIRAAFLDLEQDTQG